MSFWHKWTRYWAWQDRSRKTLAILLFAGLALIIISGLVSVWANRQYREALHYERIAKTTRGQIDSLYQLLLGAESSQRGFLLSGKSEYLKAYLKAMPEIPLAETRLRENINKLNIASDELSDLEDLISEKIEVMKMTVAVQEQDGQEQALSVVKTDEGEDLMNDIRDVLTDLNQNVQLLAQQHERFARNYSNVLEVAVLITTPVTALIVALFGILARWEIARRSSSENELRSAQDAALAASRAKSQFLAMISHEIRTPLNGIIGIADLLRSRATSSEDRRQTDILYRSSKSLLTLVNQILDIAKIESGKVDVELVEFSPLQLLETTTGLYQAKAQEKGLNLEHSIDPRIPEKLLGDAAKVGQVLQNFVSNAIKFTTQGSVKVLCELRNQSETRAVVRFEIRDTGRGIAPNDIKSLFQPFQQLNEASDLVNEGTGLGLSICKGLIEKMGGTLGVESNIDVGSSFWFQLPFKPLSHKTLADLALPPAAAPLTPSQDSTSAQMFSNGRVLIVDDNDTNLMIAEDLLKNLGYLTAKANSGEAALSLASHEHFDIVLMDCQMPHLDGFQTTRKLRDLPAGHYGHTPILAMTANALSAHRDQCLQEGMNDVLVKPVEQETLKAALERWLPKQRAINWSPLRDLERKTSTTVAIKIVDSFLTTLPNAILEIEKALAVKDSKEIRRWAHHILPSASIVGAQQLANHCRDLQDQIDQDDRFENCSAATLKLLQVGRETEQILRETLRKT